MIVRRYTAIVLLLILVVCQATYLAQTAQPAPAPDPNDPIQRIKGEGMNRSQVMQTLSYLSDVIGPRLTNSPGMKRANEWTRDQLTKWGLQNAHLEPWNFNHPGWLNERLTAHIISPVKDPLVCEVLAWTPSTKGTVQAKAYQLVLPERPTQEQLTIFLNNYKAKVRGKIVLIGKPAVIPVNLNPPAKRSTGEQIEQRYGPNARPFAFPTPSPTPTPAPNAPRPLTNRQIAEELFIAERTADTHVEHILAKLGLGSRTQVATWVVEQGDTASGAP